MTSSPAIKVSALDASLKAAFVARSKTTEAQAAAFDRFEKYGFPNRRVEGWKWSDFNAAMRQLAPANDQTEVRAIASSVFAGLNPIEIQIIDGRIVVPENESLEGTEFGILDPVGTSPHMDDHAIAALNVALTRKAFGFNVKKGVDFERPFLIRHINNSSTPVFTQTIARAEEGTRLKIIESFEGAGAYYSTLFHLGVREGAHVERYVLQDAGADMITHAFCGVMVGRSAQFKQTSLSTGGALCRHETHMLHPSDNGVSVVDSASLLSGERHGEFMTIIGHQGVGGKTRQLHKGVARDRGRNVFQGKFLVERNAQKTDAKMTANALLLSDNAEANHKPELEIYADDVECAHGSTSGALDEEALFYLRQRGLDEHGARALLIEAFVGEVIDDIADEAVRSVFRARVNEWLEMV